MTEIVVNEQNEWRLNTPGAEGWEKSPRPGARNKYLMISADTHANEPGNLWAERIDAKYKDRLPKMWIDDKGIQWRKMEASEQPDRLVLARLEGEDLARSKAGATATEKGPSVEQRLKDLEMDGIDGEIIFPGKGLGMWYTFDPAFAHAQCEVYNTWAWETFGAHVDRLSPAAALATGDLPATLKEVERCLKLGFRHFTLPCKPLFGPPKTNELNYNKVDFDPMWAMFCEADVPVSFHVSTGKDPRTTRGLGGAVVNYVVHSLSPTLEPLVNICASGVGERFPELKFGSVEAGIGWLPWMLDAMDEAYLKHHFWVKPKLKALPSDYFRAKGFATFGEDRPGLALIEEYGLQDNFMWANDYPHHEGTWPHSAEAIERQMGKLGEATRAKVLGENAAKVFGFKEAVERHKAKA
ncbi:putative metal-dependent hydrolase of the TIM-barrel fold protein [Variovorax sp. PBL-H6]|uniref:amidohydrolase family protein n=1 Tax=Variovorax sp. PBL-H6 TaxID=434009 RepID=UPI001318264A|nr:amidohydrolase family protein [Variovorax sp. PBL-H6]VTU31917.1 putative metal-dependent hydrolase of the TIM-barrel fold protein [Variovorax sp. PBL-H6]